MSNNSNKLIQEAIQDSSSVFQAILNNTDLCKRIHTASELCIQTNNKNNKLLF